MAKRLAPDDVEVIEHRSNLVGFDHEKLREAMEKLVGKREDVATANQEAGVVVKNLVSDQGVEAGGFKLAVSFMKMSEEGRNDRLRTFFACMKAANLMPATDLVDLMESA